MNKKRTIGIIAVAVVCLAIIIIGKIIDGKAGVTDIYDSSGKKFASITYADGKASYDCDQTYYTAVSTCYEECVKRLSEELKLSEAEAKKYISEHKLDIYTTIDTGLQDSLAEMVLNGYSYVDGNLGVCLNDNQGRILACFSYSVDNPQNNYVLAKTYAGSTLKPVTVYAPAIEERIVDYSSVVMDEPFGKIRNTKGELIDWPSNVTPYTYEYVPVYVALEKSLNTIAVSVLKRLGVEKSLSYVEAIAALDLSEEKQIMLEKGEDEVLGNVALGYLRKGINVADMAGIYQIFNNGGKYHESYVIDRITVDNKKEITYTSKEYKIFDEKTAYIVNRLLTLVVSPDGTAASAMMDDMEICGKTGTSDDAKDNWFIGFDESYVCAIWFGNENGVDGEQTKTPVRLARDIFAGIGTKGAMDIPVPEGVTEVKLCKETCRVAGENCKDTITAYYLTGFEPEGCNE